MPVDINQPIVIPAKPERTYDKLWVVNQNASAPNFGACSLNAILRPYRVEGDLYEFAPNSRRLHANDANLFTLHQRRPNAVAAIEAALAELGINVPEGVPAQMFVMEIVARAWGALAQAKMNPDAEPSSSSTSSTSEPSSTSSVSE